MICVCDVFVVYSPLSLPFSFSRRQFLAGCSAGTIAPPHAKQGFFSMAWRSDTFSAISAAFSCRVALLFYTMAFACRSLKKKL
jgi:hypothetical protein